MTVDARRRLLRCISLAGACALTACGLDVIGLGGPPPEIDQQNPLDGPVVDQGIGRFSELDGSPDPTGSSYDLQDAQTFVAGADGQLTFVQVAILNPDGATEPVILEIRKVEPDPGTLSYAPVPGDDLSSVLGRVAVPASAIVDVDPADPDTWPLFDVSVLGIEVVAGATYCFSLLTSDTVGFTVSPEVSLGYPAGAAWRRNRALDATWTQVLGADLGFRTWVWSR